ncbi:HAMP domain-containing histidine kinase [Frankia sp. AgB1.8]|nr:HAMP domain-containing histidine kinase [Frankia sp. AgB1.8]
MRLTAVYGALFLLSGAGLLAITYALMWHVPGDTCYTGPDGLNACVAESGGHGDAPSTAMTEGQGRAAAPFALTPEDLKALAADQHAHEMHQLLIRSGIALAVAAATSVALGWLVAGRVLRPLRRITEATQAISATNLHERLAVPGPDDELRRLADTIDALLGRLDAAFDAQRRFVANASHELRTPLTVIRAMLQMTLTDPDATLDTVRATCQEVLVEGERQDRLIDALLVLARSERGLDHREPLDLAGITEAVLATVGPKSDLLQIDVRAALDVAPTAGDVRLAERLVTNLVDNALHHNLAGGRVDIETGTTPRHAFLTVSNTGPAICLDDVDRLFQPFQRLGADSTASGDGLGLGLSIVQAIATAHDATIQARPRPAGGGLRIQVDFPLGQRSSETQGRPKQAAVRD